MAARDEFDAIRLERLIARELSRRQFLIAGGALGLGGLLAACTPGSSTNPTTSAAAHNDTLNVGLVSLAKQTGDPHTAYVHPDGTFCIGHSVAEQLVRRDFSAKHVPNLASDWKISSDNLTWTFTLRTGIKNQDGSLFTARDVKTALDRVTKYSTDFPIYSGLTGAVDNYKVIDDSHFSITTKQPWATMLDDLPYPIATDYYNSVGETAFRKQPIAAGAWKFVSVQTNQGLTFQRHEGYFDQSRFPNFKNLNLLIVPEESTRVAGIESGSLDLAFNLSHNSAQQLSSSGISGVRVLKNNGPCVAPALWFQDFNPTKGNPNSPLGILEVRQALIYALDRESIAKNLYGGDASVPANLILPSSLGYDPNLKPIPYDVAKAKQLLAAAGHSNLSWNLSSKTADPQITDVQLLCQAMVGYWKAAGMNVTYTPYDSGVLGDLQDSHKLTGAKLAGWTGPSLYEPAVLANNYLTSASDNSTNDPKIDALVQQMLNQVDETARAKVTKQFADYMYNSVTMPPIVTLPGIVGAGPHVAQYTFMTANPAAGPFWGLLAS
jgi:peptide/nickel transport system substrate-binding protein